MKKLDRFERAVRKNQRHDEWGIDIVNADDVIKLLRKEHAWMRRMVKKVDAWACQELADNDDVVSEILKQLDQRRK